MDDLTGKNIRGYLLQERIGEGGFGVVYRAHQPAVKRDVVMKVILPIYANNPDFIRNFEAEAQLIARLEHLHIVPLYDYWRGPEGAFLVMRWLRGGSLLDSITQGAWPLMQVVRLLDQIASALTIAHRNDIIHQDIKPANILLDEDQNGYLTDFGLAVDLQAGIDLSVSSTNASVRGSPAYISPEQIKRAAISPQTDIYSLGIVLYELLSGQHPFGVTGVTNVVELLRHQLNSQLPLIQTHRAELPDSVNIVLWRATAKDPAVRYASVVEMADAFRQAVGNYQAGDSPAQPRNRSDRSQPQSVTGIISLSSIDALVAGPPNPFKGLRAFQEADAADFFGRDALVETLIDKLTETSEAHRFLAVVGPSGSGKSSVIKAGLIPAIRKGLISNWRRWFLVELTPGAHPLVEITNALLKVATEPAAAIEQVLQRQGGLHLAIHAVLPDDSSELILIIDQFEEIFTQVADENERSRFLTLLHQAVTASDSRLRLIITLRADFYDRPLLYPGFGDLVRRRTEVVLPMTGDELRRAITAPAERVGLSLETGLVDRLVEDVVEQPNALPLLQFSLSELYEQRKKDQLTLDAYQAIGGVSGAVARRADELYQLMNPVQRSLTQQVFLRLVTPGEGTEDTRRRVLQSELTTLAADAGDVQSVLDWFGKYRLLTFDRDPLTRTPTVEIAHEALIRTWQQLRIWLDQSRAELHIQRQLAAAVSEWIQARKDASFLATGVRLAQFEDLVHSSTVTLNSAEAAYLDASLKRHRREERNRSIRAAAAIIAASLMAVLALLAIDQRNQASAASQIAAAAQSTAMAERDRADQQSQISRSRELAASALISADQIDLALLLSLQALDAANTFEARNSLLSLLQQHPRLKAVLNGHSDWVRTVVYSPNGQYMASGSRDGSVRLWDAISHRQLGLPLEEARTWINSAAFSHDSRYLAVGSNDGSLVLWDLSQQPPQPRRFDQLDDTIWSLAFSPDDQLLASAGADNTVRLWDVAAARVVAARSDHQDIVYAVAFSPDGQTLASGSADHTIRLWNVADLEPLQTLQGHSNWVFALAFSPDGQTLASGSADNTIRLWNLFGGQSTILRGHENWVRTLLFNADGSRLISGGFDGLIILWDTAAGVPVDAFASVSSHAIWSISLSPDGGSLLSGGTDSAMYEWNLQPGPPLGSIVNTQPEQILALAISSDGTLLASAGGLHSDFGIQLYDTADGQTQMTLKGHQDEVTSLAFSPTRPWLASGSLDRTVMIWNIETGEMLGTLSQPDSVFTLAFRPDGQQLAVGDNTGAITLWNLQDPSVLGQDTPQKLTGHQDRILSLAYHPDGSLLASGSRDATIRLWDMQSGQAVGEPLTGQTDGILKLDFSPDGHLLASAGRDTTVRLWERTNSGWQASGEPLTGHTNWVVDVQFSPDSQILASASGDQSIILWDAHERTALGSPLRGHTDWVNALAFSRDGADLYSGGRDGRVIRWQVGLTQWRQQACQVANRNFTPDEQQHYFEESSESMVPCPSLDQENVQ
ncbi:MAG: protein kinase [Anaerolineae bacterium]|nr:protein kinase [Anaerolineae bacterium]